MNQKPITKEQAVEIFGSQAELARALGIERSAVCQWKDGAPIPEKQELRIRYELRPELFNGSAA
jgi:DNA-binding transcriptional regulator YdaS (Cro superfamily)